MAILTSEPVQIIRGLKADIAQRTGSDGELNWATDSKELYIHDGKTRGGHLIGKVSGTASVVGGAGIAVSTSDGISTVSIKRDPSSVLYATTDGAGVRLGNSGGLQVTAQNALDLHLAEGGGLVVDSNGLKVDSSVLTSVFRYAGQVNSVDDLPDDASIGDVYDVKDSGVNYVWTGSSWDNLGGILSVDPSPTQGSTNPVASGGVYDAIQAAKLSGDGKTVTVANNNITAKDIAIGGDTDDLASASGLLGTCKYIAASSTAFNIDTDVFDEVIVYSSRDNSHGTFPYTGWWIVRQFNYFRTPDSRLQVAFEWGGAVRERIYTRYWWNNAGAWSPWVEFVTSSSIGDGITVNNGILSVPEYEGANADTAATSGLVPPAAAGEQNKVLRGDGEWGDYLPLSGGNMTGKITSTANTALEQRDSNVSIADTSRSTSVNKMLAVSLDKDGKRGGGVELRYYTDGSREIHFTMRNRADTGWLLLGLKEQADGFSVGRSPNPKANSNTNDIATTAWVRDRIAEIDIPSEVTLSDSVTSDSSTTAASSKAVKTAYDRASIAITNASTAKRAADAAQEAADAAQTTANEAKTAAQNAASAASTAQSTASAAQNTANSANTAATNAQNTANTANNTAKAAKTSATNAQNTANKAGAICSSVAVWGESNTKHGLYGSKLPNYGTWRVLSRYESGNSAFVAYEVAGGESVTEMGIAVRIS